MSLKAPALPVTGSIYTDSGGLDAMRARASGAPDATLRQAAEQFEALFLQMMLSSMRAAKLADGVFDSDATRFYQDLYDKQLGLTMGAPGDSSRKTPLGIADMLMRQLAPAQEGHQAATPESGTSGKTTVNEPGARQGVSPAADAILRGVASDQHSAGPGETPVSPFLAALAAGAGAPPAPQARHASSVAEMRRFSLDPVAPPAPSSATHDAVTGMPAGVAADLGALAAEAARVAEARVAELLQNGVPEFGFSNVAAVAGTSAKATPVTTAQAAIAPAADTPARGATVPRDDVRPSSGAARATASPGPSRFDSPENFVRELWDDAELAARELGVKPEVLLAQAALETGWGRHLPRHSDGASSHNLFGIKATSRWHGDRVQQMTSEFENGRFERRVDGFRAYDDYAASFRDYVDLLQSSSRYRKAVAAADDPSQFFRELQRAGYATDPGYANKLISLLSGDTMRGALAARPAAG